MVSSTMRWLICLHCLVHAIGRKLTSKDMHVAQERRDPSVPLASFTQLLLAANPAGGWQVAGAQRLPGSSLNKPRVTDRSHTAPLMMADMQESDVWESDAPAANATAFDPETALGERPVFNISDPKKYFAEAMGFAGRFTEFLAKKDQLPNDEQEAIVRSMAIQYIEVLTPAIAFAFSEFAFYVTLFVVIVLALNLSGYGYSQILAFLSGFFEQIPFVGGFMVDKLQRVPPEWGNAGLAFASDDFIIVPLSVPLAIRFFPVANGFLMSKLEENNLGAQDFSELVVTKAKAKGAAELAEQQAKQQANQAPNPEA